MEVDVFRVLVTFWKILYFITIHETNLSLSKLIGVAILPQTAFQMHSQQ